MNLKGVKNNMSDYNQLLNDITNTEITKNELQKQLDILSKEYDMECKELQRLNDKNLEYSSALKEQENQKRLQDESQQREQDKQNLSNFVNELSNSF